jgi:hypothetical protein
VNTTTKRLADIMEKLSPEEKAKLIIEDLFRDKPTLSPKAQQKALRAMNQEEGLRYNAYLDRYNRLKGALRLLQDMGYQAASDLYARDRILFYQHALNEVVDALEFPTSSTTSPANNAGEALLVNNPNLKPGKPLELKLYGATLRLGVWGRKRSTYPPRNAPQVELHEKPLAALDMYAQRIRETAADMKAIHHHIVEAAQEMGLEFLQGWAHGAVEHVRQHDRSAFDVILDSFMEVARKEGREEGWEPVRKDASDSLTLFVTSLPNVQKDGEVDWNIFRQEMEDRDPREAWGSGQSVDDRWALVWEDIEENAETLRRIRETPLEFIPSSWDNKQYQSIKSTVLKLMKDIARKRSGNE